MLQNKPLYLTGAALLVTGLTLTSHCVLAADIFWDDSTIGDWSTATNWVGDIEPSSIDNVIITNGGTAQVTSTNESASSLSVGNNGTKGALEITNGGEVINNDTGYIGDQSGSTGTVTVDGAGSAWTNNRNLYVGRIGMGTLVITNGGEVSNSDIGYIGDQLGSIGIVRVDGADSTWINNSTLFVGRIGSGTLAITNGGKVSNVSTAFIGDQSGSTGTVTVDGVGSTWTNNSTLSVGRNGMGTLAITNGGGVSNGFNGFVGNESGSNGSVKVDGEGSTWTNNSALFVGNSGTGRLAIINGGKVSNVFNGLIGNESGSLGTVTVDGAGSTWINNRALIVGRSGTGMLAIANRGEVDVTSGSVILASQTGSIGTLIIGAALGESALSAGSLNAENLSFGGGTGKLIFNHTNTYYDFNSNITGSGTIDLFSGTTHLGGDLKNYSGQLTVNGGALLISDGEKLELGGDYTQTADSLFRTSVSSTSSYGQLAVVGTATFAVGSNINIDVSNAKTLANGNTLPAVLSAGTLSASTFTLTDNSALFNFTATVNGHQVDIETQALTSGVLGSVVNNNLPSATGAAIVLDGFITAGTINTDVDNVVAALGQLETEAQVAQAAAETLPLLAGVTENILLNNQRALGNVLYSRLAGLQGLSSGDGFITNKNVWLKPFGSFSKQDNRHGFSGNEAESYGFVTGIDSELNERANLGFALSYMNTGVDGRGIGSGNSADVDSYRLMAYGRQAVKGLSNVDVLWQASVGLNQVDNQRQISFINRKAEASYDSTSAHVGVGLAQAIKVNESMTVVPSLRADYSYSREDSYSEKGAGALNLEVDNNEAERLSVMGEATLNHQFNANTKLSVNIGAGYDVISERASLTSRYSGGGAVFVTQGITTDPWRVKAGIGINIDSSATSTITGVYDVEKRNGFLNQTASVRFKWQF